MGSGIDSIQEIGQKLLTLGRAYQYSIYHLSSRYYLLDRYSQTWIDQQQEVFTFPLWNLSGQLVGYQQYRPNGDKKQRRNPKEGKYFTYVSPGQIGVWGLDVLDPSDRRLFVTEGVFKSCRLHNFGLNSIAVLGNNPKKLIPWLCSMGYEIICICDGDTAGKKLAKLGHKAILLPDGMYLDEMNGKEIKDEFAKYQIDIT